MTRSRWIYLVPLGMVAAGIVLAVLDRPGDVRTKRPLADLEVLAKRDDLNVLFLLVDTLRADRLSCYGYERPTSPTIDSLAESGIRFARHRSQSSWTKASMASLWSGLHPIRTGVLRFNHALPEEALLPAELLHSRGMDTAGIWRNGWVAANFGFAQGFDLYHKPIHGSVRGFQRRDPPTSRIGGSDQDITDSALEFLRLHAHRPWFLYLHYMDVHQYLSDEASARFGTSYSDIYDNSIHWVDRQIGSVLEAIDAAGIRDRTLIVLASDHGEAFGEHGNEGHAKDLYGEVTRTPLILGLPFRLEPGVVVESVSENVDIWPTILDIIGEPPLAESDGRSLVEEVLATTGRRLQPTHDERPAFAHLDRTWGRRDAGPRWIVAVTDRSHRLIRSLDGRTRDELYDLDADPGERRNVYGERADVARDLGASLDAYLSRSPASWALNPTTVDLDDMLLGQLRAIGYAIE